MFKEVSDKDYSSQTVAIEGSQENWESFVFSEVFKNNQSKRPFL